MCRMSGDIVEQAPGKLVRALGRLEADTCHFSILVCLTNMMHRQILGRLCNAAQHGSLSAYSTQNWPT